jgi:lysozyme
MDKDAVGLLVRAHEGIRHVVYRDTRGILTIGIGCNLERPGIYERIKACGADFASICNGTQALQHPQVEALFADDLYDAIAGARKAVTNFESLPTGVQSVVVDMVFNLGESGFRKFVKAIECLEKCDFRGAAAEMRDSRWAKQVPMRAATDIALVQAAGK